MSRCNEKLRAENKPYPRTCSECGLGPCKHPETGDELFNAIGAFHTARTVLRDLVEQMYPPGCVVEVDNLRFRGMGFCQQHEPLWDIVYVQVLVSNGNTWSYEIETITRRVDDRTEWPQWIKERKR